MGDETTSDAMACEEEAIASDGTFCCYRCAALSFSISALSSGSAFSQVPMRP